MINVCFYLHAIFQADVEDTLKRIQGHKGVIGTIVVNGEGKINLPWFYCTLTNLTVVILFFILLFLCQILYFSWIDSLFVGIPVRTTLDNSTTVQYAGLLHQLTMKARSTVRDIDPQNDLTFLRIRSKKHEIMVAPGTSPHYLMLPFAYQACCSTHIQLSHLFLFVYR